MKRKFDEFVLTSQSLNLWKDKGRPLFRFKLNGKLEKSRQRHTFSCFNHSCGIISIIITSSHSCFLLSYPEIELLQIYMLYISIYTQCVNTFIIPFSIHNFIGKKQRGLFLQTTVFIIYLYLYKASIGLQNEDVCRPKHFQSKND